MLKKTFYLLIFLSLVSISSAQTDPSTKYILDENDLFYTSFFTANNTASIYNALNLSTYIKFSQAPSTPTSPGVSGQVAYQNNYLYICVSNNNWRRIRMGTW